MALALFATPANYAGTASSSLSQAVDVGSGSDRLLVVGCAYFSSSGEPSITAITYNGVAVPLVAGSRAFQVFATRNYVAEWYALPAPAAGSNTLAITFGSSIEYSVMPVVFEGAHQTTPTGDVDIVLATDPYSLNMTTVQDNSYLLQIVAGRNNAGPYTPTSPATEWIDHTGTGLSQYGGYRTTTTSGAYTIAADATGTNATTAVSSAVEVREATGGSGGGQPPRTMHQVRMRSN